MSKPLKVDKDGRLAVSEADVEQSIQDFLEAEGWTYIHTKAEHVKRNGAPSHESGTLDAVAVIAQVRIDISCCEEPGCHINTERVLFIEHKRRRAKTDSARLKKQAETAAELERRGFDAYRAPEGYSGDMVAHFKDWYGRNF